MNAEIKYCDPIRVVMLRHTGSYDGIGPVFDQLWSWVTSQNVPVQRTIGIYWDNPDEVPVAKLRSAACVEIPTDYQVTDGGGLTLVLDNIAAGEYATTRYVGPYENLAAQWSDLGTFAEQTMGRTISQNPAFEVYVNDPSDTAPHDLITELYMPVQ